MRWHIELILEVALFGVLIWKASGLRWFDTLIGIDLVSQFLQVIPYRSGYHGFARLFWQYGVVAIAACRGMALIEAAYLERSRRSWWHIRILAFWVSGVTACAWLEVGQSSSMIFAVNNVLLCIQAISYVAWSMVFLLDQA